MANRYNSRLAKIVGSLNRQRQFAIVLGQTAYYSVSKDQVGPDWRCHEDQHKRQYREHGVVGFLIKYLVYSIRYGYTNNPFEVDARNHVRDYLDSCYVHLPDGDI